MYLNPNFSCVNVDSKLSVRMNAFNGNRCPKPTPKTVPVQPRQELPMPMPMPLINQPMIRPL